jgi:hypothetical protein
MMLAAAWSLAPAALAPSAGRAARLLHRDGTADTAGTMS